MIITYLLLHWMFPGLVLPLLGLLFLLTVEAPVIQSRFTFSQLFHF